MEDPTCQQNAISRKTGHKAKLCCISQMSSQKRRLSRKVPHRSEKTIAKTIQLIKWKTGGAVCLRILLTILINLQGTSGKPYSNKIRANQTELQMKIDTGAALSIIGEKTFKTQWSSQNQPKLESSKVKLQTYTG